MLGSSATVLAFCFWQVLSLTALRVFLVELLEASVQDVHLRIEELWVFLHVQVSIELPQLGPQLGRSLLAKLAVEDQDGPFLHQFPYVVEVLEERVLQLGWVIDIQGIFDVARLVLVVPPAVNDEIGVSLPLDEVAERFRTYWIHFWLVGLSEVHLLEKKSFVSFLEEAVFDAQGS